MFKVLGAVVCWKQSCSLQAFVDRVKQLNGNQMEKQNDALAVGMLWTLRSLLVVIPVIETTTL
jgi:hypothetical protein